jgi:hypothetical protein
MLIETMKQNDDDDDDDGDGVSGADGDDDDNGDDKEDEDSDSAIDDGVQSGTDGKNEVVADSFLSPSMEYTICIIFMAHAGVNQATLWERWYASASKTERDRIHVVWWMDASTCESKAPTTIRVSHSSSSSTNITTDDARMFREANRFKTPNSVFRNHHTQATIELELLQFAYHRHPSCHHYHLVSGACIPIKPPTMFLAHLLPSSLSHICMSTCDRTVFKLASSLGIKWFDSQELGHIHFQFWVLNHTHARLLLRLVFSNDDGIDYVNDLVTIQKAYFSKKMPSYLYHDLTDAHRLKRLLYDVTLPSPCEWFILALVVHAVRKYTHLTDIRAIKQQQINVTHGIFQHHVRHGVDLHPIEFPDLDTKVNVQCIEKRVSKRKRKVIEFRQASLREVLAQDVMSASISCAQPQALWTDYSVLIVRKMGSKPLLEDTWQT